ncbi:hypothetical protein ACFQVC_07910 [Streptomyces monticola]|uniref:Uncharacterized protein n=1 Tax=Streptomyces monticola TaxID=2666263 RepID=A0ABW2JF89_9ACTN
MRAVARTGGLSELAADRRAALRAEGEGLAALDDVEFGVRLLANTPTHEGRDPAVLRRWAAAATGFGAELAATHGPGQHHGHNSPGPGQHRVHHTSGPGPHRGRSPAAVTIRESTGGLHPDRLLLARYRTRPTPTVELFTDTLALAEAAVQLLGWQAWFPPGTARAAAVAHEKAHDLLHHDKAARAALKCRLGHTVWRLPAHVAGAGELVAHAAAQATLGLPRTPLLLTAALARAAETLREN